MRVSPFMMIMTLIDDLGRVEIRGVFGAIGTAGPTRASAIVFTFRVALVKEVKKFSVCVGYFDLLADLAQSLFSLLLECHDFYRFIAELILLMLSRLLHNNHRDNFLG